MPIVKVPDLVLNISLNSLIKWPREWKSKTNTIASSLSSSVTPIYLNFSFFKVDPKWRWLNEIGKEEAAKEFSSLIEIANTKMKVRTYSTLGLLMMQEFMLWMVSDSVEKMQILTSKIYSTLLGKYLEHSQIYLSASTINILKQSYSRIYDG